MFHDGGSGRRSGGRVRKHLGVEVVIGRRTDRGSRIRRALVLGVVAGILIGPIGIGDTQESKPESGEIRNGTAKATALVSRIGPGVGELELAMRGGTSVAQLTNSLAQATSQTLDMGLIGTAATAQDCAGDQYLKPENLPQATSVDNRDGEAAADRDESGTGGSPYGMGRMHAEASKEPIRASALTKASAFDLNPALQFGSGTSRASVEVLPGKGRQADAEVVSSMDLGGVVTMDGMRWHTFHRTGTEPEATASFEYGRASVGGSGYPPAESQAFEEAANAALAPLGASIRFPRVERLVEPTDLIRVTPMRLEIRDTPAGRAVFGPLLDASRSQRGDLFDAIVGQICQLSTFLLIGDVTLSVISGTGFLILDFGGVEASSSDFQLIDPFGAPIVPPGTPVGPDAPATPARASVGSDAASPPPTTGGPATVDVDGVPANRSTGPLEELCRSIHPNHDSCVRGTGVAAGLLALLATFGVGGLEVVRQRRSRIAVEP